MTDRGEPWVPYDRWHVTRSMKAPEGTQRYGVFEHIGENWVSLRDQDVEGGVVAAPENEVVYPVRCDDD